MSKSLDLTLYYSPVSFFSQKVVMALRYLNLKFEKKFLQLGKEEQLQEWYLDINPKGEVPTLIDGKLIVPDSAAILQYLNNTYDTRRSDDEKILPYPETPVGKQVQTFTKILGSFKLSILIFGVLFHPRHSIGGQMSENERNMRKAHMEKSLESILERTKTAVSPYKECYNNKLSKLTGFVAAIKQEGKLIDELESTKRVLDSIEDQLASVNTKWLFSDFLTAADITLVIILERIQSLGLQHHFFSDGARPKTLAYFRRSVNEDFVKETFA